jgi:DNA-binding response OmpR family regulator
MQTKEITQTKTILLVEDEAEIRLIYAEILVDAGYKVIQAANGTIAKEKIQNEPWDALLLDVILPDMDGMEILRELSQENPAAIQKGPIIILTNLKSDNVTKDAYELGAAGFIVKSEVTPDQIIQEVARVLKS